MRMSCEEAWLAVTCDAALSLGLDDAGRLAPGSRADLALFDVPDYRVVPYHYGDNHCHAVVKAGRIVRQRSKVL